MHAAESGSGENDVLLRMVSEQADQIAALKAELAERRDQVRAILEHNPHPTWIYSLQTSGRARMCPRCSTTWPG